MQNLSFSIADDVFARFPGYVRGVVLAHGVTNGPSPAELVALLRAAEDEVRRTVDAAIIAEHPRIRAWREAFRTFGAKPSEYRSSIEAWCGGWPAAIRCLPSTALVDLGNVVSLRHLLPAGAHAIDRLTADIWLRPAKGVKPSPRWTEKRSSNPFRRDHLRRG